MAMTTILMKTIHIYTHTLIMFDRKDDNRNEWMNDEYECFFFLHVWMKKNQYWTLTCLLCCLRLCVCVSMFWFFVFLCVLWFFFHFNKINKNRSIHSINHFISINILNFSITNPVLLLSMIIAKIEVTKFVYGATTILKI